SGHFRLDLYYRLAVIQIDIPPLRERGDDVLLFAKHYVDMFAARSRRKFKGLSPEVERIFRAYAWPGNVRELRNVIERATLLEDGDVITSRYLPAGLVRTASHGGGAAADRSGFQLPPEGISLEEVEMSFVRQALELSGGNQTRAAELLGITRDQLRYRMKKIEHEPESIS
ncbi:MAG TPA: helix-turn-helix domain-containing protein, partial [Blastocatellia bacterium]|nr:helix-turn-helix domain-containing protein [Blastocatellia bacterium]